VSVPPECLPPISEWTKVVGDVQAGVGNATFVDGTLVYGLDPSGGAFMPIDERHPELAGLPVALPELKGVAAAARAGQHFYVVGSATPDALFSISQDGTLMSTPTTFQATSLRHGNVAALADRVVVAGGEGNGTFRIDSFDGSLAPLSSLEMPKHSAGTLTSQGGVLKLAVINAPAKMLEIYQLSDDAPALLRMHALTTLTLLLTWAGDSVLLQSGPQLLLIAPDDSRTDIELPPAVAGSTNLASLTAATSPLGTAFSLAIDNKAYLGLLRNGAVEWDGPTEQIVFADVRADAGSLGAYSVSTLRERTIIYSGRRCAPQ
jgi:hypothetical protein